MYLVDSNVLIEAKNRYYAFDIAPGFWAWLDYAYANGIVCSIEPVRDELVEGDDELAVWARGHTQFFLPIDAEAAQQFGPLTVWAQSRNYTAAALQDFLTNAADFFLVAYAAAHSHTLVTHEQPRPEARKRVLIPDACQAMGVKYANTFMMLRSTNVRLDLQLPAA
jgi:predicted nucleic acid-binding protein